MKRSRLESCHGAHRHQSLVEYCAYAGYWRVRTRCTVLLPRSHLTAQRQGVAAVPSALSFAQDVEATEQLVAPTTPVNQSARQTHNLPSQEKPAVVTKEEAVALVVALPNSSSLEPPKVVISYIHYLGATKRTQADEFIELFNMGDEPAALGNWRIEAGNPDQVFVFPIGTQLQPRARLRVYTDAATLTENTFSFGSKRALWNDDGDLGRLFDASLTEVSHYGYGEKETRTVASIQAAHGVLGLQVVHDPRHLQVQQSYRSRIDFLTAVERAIRFLLEDSAPSAQTDLGNASSSQGAQQQEREPLPRTRGFLSEQRLRLLHTEDLLESERTRLRKEWLFCLEPVAGMPIRIAIARSGTEPVQAHGLPKSA